MNGRVHKLVRKAASDSGKAALAAMSQMGGALNANEEATRKRVETLERRCADLEMRCGGLATCVFALEAVWQRGWRGRLRWLLTGK